MTGQMRSRELSSVDRERIRRMAVCWREQACSEFEIAMARRRIAHRSSERLEPRTSLIVALATVLAALLTPPIRHGLYERSESSFAAPSSDAMTTTAPAMRAVVSSNAPSPLVEPVSIASARPEKTTRSSTRVHRIHRVAKRPPAPQPAIEVSFADIPDDGFRPDPFIQDIAALSRAYLWVSDGEVERAKSLLERLADSGASERIRRRASELLIRASEPPPSSSRSVVQRPSLG